MAEGNSALMCPKCGRELSLRLLGDPDFRRIWTAYCVCGLVQVQCADGDWHTVTEGADWRELFIKYVDIVGKADDDDWTAEEWAVVNAAAEALYARLRAAREES